MPKKILVIDAQVFQTPAWHRGMGKYSMELIVALSKLSKDQRVWSEIEVIFSKKLPTEEAVITTLSDRAPEVTITRLNLVPNEYDSIPAVAKNRKVIDAHIKIKTGNNKVEKVDFLVLSLMQSEVAPAFSSLGKVNNILLFYDLIPLMFNKTYLKDKINQKSYYSKLSELLRADTYVAISKTVANDLALVLGIDKERIFSIDGAPIEHSSQPEPIKVPKPFILMPTGNDLRKNNLRGVQSFEKFNVKQNYKYHMVITSVFQDFEVEEYKKVSKNLIFTGNVSGAVLDYLYETTDILFFPTEYEGLGLPILEALEKEKPVACSNISVFNEISKEAFLYFNPLDVDEMSRSLNKAVSLKKLPLNEYRRVLKKFKWSRTAILFKESTEKHKSITSNLKKPRISVISASPGSESSRISMQHLYSELQRECTPILYLDQAPGEKQNGGDYLSHITSIKGIASPTTFNIDRQNRPVYFIANNKNYASVLVTALANPGVLVLLDTKLDVLWEAAINRKLIHKSRFDIEQAMDRKYHIKSNNCLTTLLMSQEVVVLLKASNYELVKKILDKIPLRGVPKLISTGRPSPVLVYPDLKPSNTLLDYPEPETIDKGEKTVSYKQFVEIIIGEAVTNNG